ncbi:MAG TPA: hypothetical protein VJR92_07240 [Gemmatimonadaceae bacterium]|nr:hypothetical protein [Gemmatimonadaceae bacterium]
MLAVGSVLSACSDDDSNGPSTTVMLFVGTVNGANASLSGAITLSINGTVVTGTFDITTPSVASHALTGTYNTGTKGVTASGGGYTFTGVYNGSTRIEGDMSGSATGIFVAPKGNSNLAYCGEFSGDSEGVWNFTIAGSTLFGTATTVDDDVIPLGGNISGNTITVTASGAGTIATGTRSGDDVDGFWDTGVESGTWFGSKCN